jgi:UDP-glucose 4-epimerase
VPTNHDNFLFNNSNSMNTCIIGGHGFIGTHLVEELRKTGRDITIVSRGKTEFSNVTNVQVESVFNKNLEALIPEMDEIVCLAYATKPKTSFDNPIKDIEENLAQTVHLFEIASKSKRLKKIIYVSSGGAIYGHTDDELITEDHATKPISPYGITKMAIEHYAHLYYTLYRLPIVIVRPSNAYGPGQMAKEGQGFIAYALQSVLRKQPIEIFGKEGTIRDYIYVTDLAKALQACLEKGTAGATYNAGLQHGYSNLDIVNVIKEITEEKGYEVTVKHTEARPFDVNRNVLNTSKIKSETGWEPKISIEEGLRTTLNWLSELKARNNDIYS